jgi:hypothetical protein
VAKEGATLEQDLVADLPDGSLVCRGADNEVIV